MSTRATTVALASVATAAARRAALPVHVEFVSDTM